MLVFAQQAHLFLVVFETDFGIGYFMVSIHTLIKGLLLSNRLQCTKSMWGRAELDTPGAKAMVDSVHHALQWFHPSALDRTLPVVSES